jgi:uncharacterized membrane protein
MAFYEQTIVVNVPVEVAFQQWMRFEEFPEFMEGVIEVQRPAENIMIWRADIGGEEQMWSAEVTESLPNRRIVWQSTSGARHIGIVTFVNVTSHTTNITLQIEYDPLGYVENAGAAFGAVECRIRGDLQRFKTLVETRELVMEALRN